MQIDRIPRITQAPGAIEDLGRITAGRVGRGASVLLVADPGLGATGITATAKRALEKAGLGVAVFEDFKSDPATASVDAGAVHAIWHKAGAVVALGGGSALDVGKAIACVAAGDFSADEYALCARPLPSKPLVKVCVPTTSGTGSETTRTSVLTRADGSKTWLWGDEMKADEVVLDPALTVGLPAHLTAATGIDALVHALEASTNANASAANDIFAHAAIRLGARHLVDAVERPTDLDARTGLQLAATLAGIAIDNAGTAIGHAIGHALASLRPIHHGRAVGVAVLATLGWNAEEDPDGRFAAVASAMGESGGAAALPGAFERLLRRSGVKVSLRGEGHDDVAADTLLATIQSADNAPMLRSNARKATETELAAFAARVLAQD
jgi:alcohol dehydrogenase class IV